MPDSCHDWGPLCEAFADGAIEEADAERLRRHLSECASCHHDLHNRAALRRALSRITLPPAPPQLHSRILKMLDREDRGWIGRPLARWSTLAAAGLIVATLLTIVLPARADVPRFVRSSAEIHNRLSQADRSSLLPQLRRTLGCEAYCPSRGECICHIPQAIPWIVYRCSGTLVSRLVTADESELPVTTRRIGPSGEYYFFHVAENNVLVCRRGGLCTIWVARLREEQLLAAVLSTKEGKQSFEGTPLTTRDITCEACCALKTSERNDLVSMDLLLAGHTLDVNEVLNVLQRVEDASTPRR